MVLPPSPTDFLWKCYATGPSDFTAYPCTKIAGFSSAACLTSVDLDSLHEYSSLTAKERNLWQSISSVASAASWLFITTTSSAPKSPSIGALATRSEDHTSELQS